MYLLHDSKEEDASWIGKWNNMQWGEAEPYISNSYRLLSVW